MTKILTVDDSRAVRAIVKKGLGDLGFEIFEAEDGEKGLEALEANSVDLILLDVTMPVMDGPTMLKLLRERGDETPVIALTAESKTTIIGEMMKAGISDYILKPFKAEGLREKIAKALRSSGNDVGVMTPPSAKPKQPTGSSAPVPAAGKPFVDILLVDDMDNVAKKFKTLLPPHLKFNSVIDGQSAVAKCKERIFRTVLVDTTIPDVETSVLLSQLRMLQPTAAFLALFLRNNQNKSDSAREMGFDGFMVKPFNPEEIDNFLENYFNTHEILTTEDNVLEISDFAGRAERFEKHYVRLSRLIKDGIEDVASACHEAVVLDLQSVPESPKLVTVVLRAAEDTGSMGLELRLVAKEQHVSLFKGFQETETLAFFDTVGEAQEA